MKARTRCLCPKPSVYQDSKPCPNRSCAGGGIFDEYTGIPSLNCPTCKGHAFVRPDGSPLDSLYDENILFWRNATTECSRCGVPLCWDCGIPICSPVTGERLCPPCAGVMR